MVIGDLCKESSVADPGLFGHLEQNIRPKLSEYHTKILREKTFFEEKKMKKGVLRKYSILIKVSTSKDLVSTLKGIKMT